MRARARASEYRKKIYYILYINTILYYMLYYCTFTLFEGGDAFKQGSKKKKEKKSYIHITVNIIKETMKNEHVRTFIVGRLAVHLF